MLEFGFSSLLEECETGCDGGGCSSLLSFFSMDSAGTEGFGEVFESSPSLNATDDFFLGNDRILLLSMFLIEASRSELRLLHFGGELGPTPGVMTCWLGSALFSMSFLLALKPGLCWDSL